MAEGRRRKRRADMTPESREMRNAAHRYENMPPEEVERRREGSRKAYRNRTLEQLEHDRELRRTFVKSTPQASRQKNGGPVRSERGTSSGGGRGRPARFQDCATAGLRAGLKSKMGFHGVKRRPSFGMASSGAA